MATLAKPQNKLAQKPQPYREVGDASTPVVKGLNGVGKQIHTNNKILSSIANSLMRRRNVDHKIQRSLYNDIERRREALKRLNKSTRRPQLGAPNLQRRRPTTPEQAKAKNLSKKPDVDDGGGLGILNGVFGFFRAIAGGLFKAFIMGAAFKWLSDPNNARRFADAFGNFYRIVLKPLVGFVIGWTTWALDGVGSAGVGISKIINGVKNGEIGELLTGFGDLLKGLPAIGSVALLLNPVGTLKFVWGLVKSILGIAPPREQGLDGPKGKPKPKPKPDAPRKPNFLQRQIDRARNFGGRVVEGAKKQIGEIGPGLRKLGNGFRSGLVEMGKGINGIKDAAMRKLVEPAIEYVKPLLNKLRGLKGSIEKKLMQILGPKGAKILKELGGKGSEGLLKKIGSKAIPIVGGIANLYFGYEALKNGDPIGALLEFTSGAFDLIGLIPGGQWGPMVSMGLDIYNFIRGMVPGITDAENKLVKSLGLDPIMNAVKEFGSKLPGAETGKGPGSGDPRVKSGNYLVGALEELLKIMPGSEILKNEFGPAIYTARRAFGSGIVSISESPVTMSSTQQSLEMLKGDFDAFFQSTVDPIKDALGKVMQDWLGRLPSALVTTGSNLLRNTNPALSSLLGLGDAESVTRSTGAPTLDANRNYGIKEGEKFFFSDEKGQQFHAVNTGSGLQFYEGGVAGVGGRLRHTTNADGTAANQGMVQAFLQAKGEGTSVTAGGQQAGTMSDVGRPGKIFLHWTGGAYDSTYGGYHTVITGDGKIHRKAKYSNRGREHTWRRNSQGVGISVASMASSENWNHPTKDVQWASMANEAAALAKAWGWNKTNITRANVQTHAEAAVNADGAGNHPNYGPHPLGGQAPIRWDMWYLRKADKQKAYRSKNVHLGGDELRGLIKQRMNKGGIVYKGVPIAPFKPLGDGEDTGHDRENYLSHMRTSIDMQKSPTGMNLGGLVNVAESRGARVLGQSSGINRESILHPGITRAPVEIGAVQRVIMPIPTPMSASAGGGGGSAPPSPLSTFGR